MYGAHEVFDLPMRYLALLFVMLAPTILFADVTADQARIDKFLKQRNFDRAEFICRERLSDSRISTRDRAAYTIELLRVVSRQAEVAAREERQAIFASADREIAKYLNYDRDSPQRLLVRFQAALLTRLKAVLRQYDRPRSVTAAADPAILKDFRDTNRQLRMLSRDVEEGLRRDRNRDPNKEERLTRKELTNLRARILLELGKTYQQQADAYPIGSDDRILAATESVQYLQKLSPASLSEAMWASSQLKLLAGYRIKGDWVGAAKLLRSFAAQSSSPSTRLGIHAELLRIAHKQQNWKRLEQLLVSQPNDAATSQMSTRAEWSLAVIESYLGLAVETKGQGNARAATDWEGRATALLDERREEFGLFWVRRVQSVMAAAIDNGEARGSASTSLLVHAAEGLYREGKLTEAMVAYDKAAGLAREEGDLVQAFELGRTAAGIRLKSGDRSAARKLFRDVALSYREYAKAPETHLLAIKLAAAGSGDEGSGKYAALLEEHLEAWPTSEVSSTVYYWRAQGRQTQSDWLAATRDYLLVRDESRFAEDAMQSAIDCALRWLDTKPALIDVQRLVERFVRYGARSNRDAGTLAEIGALQLSLQQDFDSANLMTRLGERLGTDQPVAERPAWHNTAHRLLVIAHARRQDSTSATRELAEVRDLSPAEWTALLQELVGLPASPDINALLGQVIARGHGFNATQKRKWDALRAQALMASGKSQEAERLYKSLIAANKNDGAAHEGYAKLLAASAQWEKSIAAYRHLAAHSQTATDRWFRAKLGIANGLAKSGQTNRAAEVVRLLEVLHPELGGAELREKFKSLLRGVRQ
jgi:thioredoxin-like negative regulator of GroEL